MVSIKKNNSANEVQNNVILTGILSTIERNNNVWSGTMTQLSKEVSSRLNKEQMSLMPNGPSSFRVVLNKIVNRLRSRGVSVKFTKSNDRLVKFSR